MAYKDPLDPRAKEARLRHYYKNKDQYLERNKKHKAKLIEFILDIKNSNPCTDCKISFKDEPWLLEFDHIGDDKEAEISLLIQNGVGLVKLQKEIDKCELVCVLCHRRRTASRGNWSTNRLRHMLD